MSTFDHKIFLWNKDHSFKDYKNQEILIEDLAEFLGCELISEEEKIKVNKENLLVPTKTLRIIKTGYLIVAKDKDSKIITEALDELEVEPTLIKEINFGWKIDKSFKYTTEDLQWAQDLQESAQALRVTGNPKKVEPADRIQSQSFAESFVEDSDTEDSSTNDCYWAKLSSFSGWSNDSNKLLEFLSWPNKTIPQTAPKQFFISDNEMNWGTHRHIHGVMNWGTNGPSLIGIACGNAETGTFENNVFKYENQEYLLPSGGQIIRVFRQPADDLLLPEQLIDTLDNMRQNKEQRRDPQDFFGHIPTVYQWVSDKERPSSHFARVYTQSGDANEGYRVQLSTKNSPHYPWIERSSDTEYYTRDYYGYSYDTYSPSGVFLYYFYHTNDDLKRLYDPDEQSDYWISYNYWYDKFFQDQDEWKPQSWDSQATYSALLNFPETQMISLDDLLLGQEPITIESPRNHLIVKNYVSRYPIKISTTLSEDKVHFNFQSINKYYRNNVSGWKSLGETIDFTIKIAFSNFCLYPGEKLEKLISFKPELQRYHGRNWSENNINDKNKNNPQNNYLGLAIKMHWKPRLINQETSEFLYPTDCRSQPTIPVTIGEHKAQLEQFQRWGCWDLLTYRITSLSCLVLFNDEKHVGSNYFQFKDFDYKKQNDNPVLLWTKMMSPADAPEDNNFASLDAPLFYWPSMADTTNILVFEEDTTFSDYNHDHATAWGYKLMSHSDFASWESRGYRKTGQDRGAVAFFVEPDAAKLDFNLSSVYGWYWIDNSVHINIKFDENLSRVVTQVTNYSLSNINFQLAENDAISLEGLTTSEWENINSNTTLRINNKLAFNINNPTDYQGLWKIKSNNQVYKDNILYGEWTEEGIQPYENE